MFVENAFNEQRVLHMWSNSEYIWPNVQHNLPNACAFHLAIVGKFDKMCSAFGQMCSANGQMRANLATLCKVLLNVQCILANAQRYWSNAHYSSLLQPTGIVTLTFADSHITLAT